MPSAMCVRVADPTTLYAAWQRTRERLDERDLPSDVAWPKSARRIERHLAETIDELSRQLLDGTWSPSQSRRVVIAKADGDDRVLHVPSVRDRIVERAIGIVLQPVIDPALSPWSFAYRPGRSVDDALRDVAWLRDERFGWVVRSDFADCFDAIDHDVLLGRLEREVHDDWLSSTIRRILRRPVEGSVRSPVTCGVAQGGPLSPMLTNLVLDDFDDAIAAAGFPMVRYADDFTLFASSRSDAAQALACAKEAATAMGMTLNDDKTTITSFEDGFAFLGEDCGPIHPIHELQQIADGDLLAKALYVARQGAWVQITNGQIVVRHGDDVLMRAPVSLVSHIVLVGAVGFSAGARSHALYHQMPVTFVSRRGSFLGRLDAAEPARAKLRRRQYRTGDSTKKRLVLARSFVAGKVANQRTLVQRYTRRSHLPVLVGAAKALRQFRRDALAAGDIDTLMGVEGAAAKCYFDALARLLPDDAGFAGRRRRPPKDPANAALGYLYAVLLGECVSALAVVGLDPVAGFLHSDSEKRPSLGLDLMEEFRPLVVDVVVVDLFRRRRLRADEHFRSDGDAVLLNGAGRKVVVGAFEERMLTLFAHVPSGKRMTYRRAITVQAQQLAAAVRGKRTYETVPWR